MWKTANVIPLKKGGDPTEVGNLRPISLLPLPGKLAERLKHTHISQFIETQGLFNPLDPTDFDSICGFPQDFPGFPQDLPKL